MCKKCDHLDEKIAYYARLASNGIDREVTIVLRDLIKALQNEKASLHPEKT